MHNNNIPEGSINKYNQKLIYKGYFSPYNDIIQFKGYYSFEDKNNRLERLKRWFLR